MGNLLVEIVTAKQKKYDWVSENLQLYLSSNDFNPRRR